MAAAYKKEVDIMLKMNLETSINNINYLQHMQQKEKLQLGKFNAAAAELLEEEQPTYNHKSRLKAEKS
jgi:hypothetical protein